jgi:hypothetical protein
MTANGGWNGQRTKQMRRDRAITVSDGWQPRR